MAKTVIKFSASWCGPCKAYAPVFDKVKQDFKDSIEFIEVDIDSDSEKLSEKYKVEAVPTTIFLEGTDVLYNVKGAISEDQLRKLFSN